MTGGLGAGETLLRAQRPAILSIAGHLVFFDQVFSVPARMRIGKRVVQAVAQNAVIKLAVAHAIAPTGARDEIRREIHILHAAGDRDVDIAECNLLRADTIAWAPEPQTRLTVSAGVVTGKPAWTAACRAEFILVPA